MGKNDERDNALRVLELEQWTIGEPNKKGYIPVRCSCPGKHMAWFHATPSNPNYYRQKLGWLLSKCANHDSGVR